jgi:hypothetical protein
MPVIRGPRRNINNFLQRSPAGRGDWEARAIGARAVTSQDSPELSVSVGPELIEERAIVLIPHDTPVAIDTPAGGPKAPT